MTARVAISPHRMHAVRAGIGGNVQATILELVGVQTTLAELLHAFEIMPGELFDELQPLVPPLVALAETCARTLRTLLPTSPAAFEGDEPAVLELLAGAGMPGDGLAAVETQLRGGAATCGPLALKPGDA